MNRGASLSCTLIVALLFVDLRCLIGCCAAAQGEAPDDEGGLSRASFPKGFVFGASTSAYQVEGMALKGGRGPSTWDSFVRVPGRILGNATANVSADEYHHYKEDINFIKWMNLDAYRFSISWSRIFPKGEGKVNWKGVAYYNILINYLVKLGITPYATLYHEDLPEALENKFHGELSTKMIKVYTDYADFCFKMFGDRVKNWITINEPRIIANYGYDSGFIPPLRCTNCSNGGNSATEPYIVAHNLILCHAAAVKRYRTIYQDKQEGRIGIALDFNWFEPHTDSAADRAAAQRALDFHVGWFLHPLIYGKYPESMREIVRERLPRFTVEQIKMVKGSIDFIGINHYTSSYAHDPHRPARSKPVDYQSDMHVAFSIERNGTQIAQEHIGWFYVVPWGMYKVVTYIKEHYNNPTMIITENGLFDPGNVTLARGIHDFGRVKYYRSYISQLKRAIDKGANVAGYFAWALVDTFEWTWGYNSRYGLIYIDFKTLRRYPKASAFWFQEMLRREKELE